MHYPLQLLAITGVMFLGVMSPGPSFALVTSTAVTVSRRAGVLTGLGFAAASCTWALLAIAGIGVLMARVSWIYAAVRILGALYLVWLGLRMVVNARRPRPAAGAAPAPAMSGTAALRKAYVVSMTNPKAIVFYGSIFSVMVPAGAPLWFYAATVAVAVLVSAGWYCGLALLLSHARAQRAFVRVRTALELTLGIVLVGLGARLLVNR